MRFMYNLAQKREAQHWQKLEQKANDYSAKLIVDVPDDYPHKAQLAELQFLDYYKLHGMLPSDQEDRYAQLMQELDTSSQETTDGTALLPRAEYDESQSIASSVGGLAVASHVQVK